MQKMSKNLHVKKDKQDSETMFSLFIYKYMGIFTIFLIFICFYYFFVLLSYNVKKSPFQPRKIEQDKDKTEI